MSPTDSPESIYMEQAIARAEGTGDCSYPALNEGAVIVDQGVVIAEASASNHENTSAILQVIHSLTDTPSPAAKLYCTLEPEWSQVEAIRVALERFGIRKLAIGTSHPCKDQSGRAIKDLQQAGFAVQTGLKETACKDLNFLSHVHRPLAPPFVAAKVALTLDGKFAAASGQSKWVTGEAARQDVHKWRKRFPAIVVGASTVLQDDPQLTARLDGHLPYCPTRCVLDTNLRSLEYQQLPQLYRDEFKEQTRIICSEASALAKQSKLQALGLKSWSIPCQPNGRLCLKSFLERCQQASIHGLYFEPGPRLLSALLDDELLDYLFIYKAPKLICDQDAQGIGNPRLTQTMEAAYTLNNPMYTQLGQDYLVRGQLK